MAKSVCCAMAKGSDGARVTTIATRQSAGMGRAGFGFFIRRRK